MPLTSVRNSPRLILITGIMAAGKSTVAQRLAERLPRSVHLRGDIFRRMIVNGQAEMGFELSSEARSQLLLRYEIATSVAKRYLEAGFSVIYQDIILGDDLSRVVENLRDYPLTVIVLCPSEEVVALREAERVKNGYGDLSVADFDRVLRQETPRIGYWLDSSSLTVYETVEEIFQHLQQIQAAEQVMDEDRDTLEQLAQ